MAGSLEAFKLFQESQKRKQARYEQAVAAKEAEKSQSTPSASEGKDNDTDATKSDEASTLRMEPGVVQETAVQS